MKKVFAILAVAGCMAACNNAENKDAKVDSPKMAADSASKMAPDTSAKKADTASKMAADTSKKAKM